MQVQKRRLRLGEQRDEIRIPPSPHPHTISKGGTLIWVSHKCSLVVRAIIGFPVYTFGDSQSLDLRPSTFNLWT